jgi:hypothetical protein
VPKVVREITGVAFFGKWSLDLWNLERIGAHLPEMQHMLTAWSPKFALPRSQVRLPAIDDNAHNDWLVQKAEKFPIVMKLNHLFAPRKVTMSLHFFAIAA